MFLSALKFGFEALACVIVNTVPNFTQLHPRQRTVFSFFVIFVSKCKSLNCTFFSTTMSTWKQSRDNMSDLLWQSYSDWLKLQHHLFRICIEVANRNIEKSWRVRKKFVVKINNKKQLRVKCQPLRCSSASNVN